MTLAKKRQPYVPPVSPADETMRRGAFRVVRVEKGGPKVAINEGTSPLRLMALARTVAGTLTEQQREAGEIFERLYRFMYGGHRADILAMVIRGYGHETVSEAEKMKRARELDRKLSAKMDRAAYVMLCNVCVHHLFLANTPAHRMAHEQLVRGLDACIEVFGLPKSDH